MVDTLVNSPLQNIFVYTENTINKGDPLRGGYLYFFSDVDHNSQELVYEDRAGEIPYTTVPTTDSSGNFIGNAVQLDNSANIPPIYFLKKEYFIVIRSADLVIQSNINNYYPNYDDAIISSTKSNFNLFTNSQFTYPVEMESLKGENLLRSSTVALSWFFDQDPDTSTINKVYIEEVSTESIEGNPLNSIVIDSSSVSSTESKKDLVQVISNNVNQWETEILNLSLQAKTLISGNTIIDVFLEKNYGGGGSDTEIISIGQLTAGTSREKLTITTVLPDNVGKVVGKNSYLALIFRFNVGQLCKVSVTNFFGIFGEDLNLDLLQFPEIKNADDISGSLFDDIVTTSDNDHYSFSESINLGYLKYYNGKIHISSSDTGKSGVFLTGKQPKGYVLAGSVLDQDGYTDEVPNSRLYDYFGDTFGSAGDLIASMKVNRFLNLTSLRDGKRPLSEYTTGTVGAKTNLTELQKGMRFGVFAEYVGDEKIVLTYLDNFAVNQAPYGAGTGIVPSGLPYRVIGCGPYWTRLPSGQPGVADGVYVSYFNCTNISPGSGTTAAVGEIEFVSSQIINYKTTPTTSTVHSSRFTNVPQSMLYFPSKEGNTQGEFYWDKLAYGSWNNIVFSVDGKISNGKVSGTEEYGIFDFKTTLTLSKNLRNLTSFINDPFEYEYEFIEGQNPSAGEYLLFSSGTADYYLWYTVDGVGVDPQITNRVGINASIPSTGGARTTAIISVEAIGKHSFNLPTEADIGISTGNEFSLYFHV